jgi:endonuclease/exonuclease/phosphatase family metal-dependent hydrolase
VQEVDNEAALRTFRESYLKKLEGPGVARTMRAIIHAEPRPDPLAVRAAREAAINAVNYRYHKVIDGNDRRGIDVGILSRLPWLQVRSHAAKTFDDLDVWPAGLETYNDGDRDNPRYLTRGDRIFKRDCLEVQFEIDGKPLTLFVCHLKSMSSGRIVTRIMRLAEMMAVRRIIEQRFAAQPGGAAGANWSICGDMNDYVEIDGNRDLRDYRTGEDSPSALGVLLDDGFAVNLVARRQVEDRWTTYHAPDDSYAQLDYILVSPALAAANPTAVPEVIRAGQPHRATRYQGLRYPRVGWDRPKASDHCPVVVELELP